jgi:putative nucleotidyltransferase with HDIG domain
MAKASFQLSDGTKVTTTTPEEQEPMEFSTQEFIDALRKDLVDNKIKLPTLPNLAMEALLVLNDVDSSANDVVKIVHKDTSITARLIRYANSPLYHGVTPVSTIKPAITRIGFDKVKSAIYAVSMKEVFRTTFKPIEQRMEALWAHSVAVGTRAAAMAKHQPGLAADIALVAGLVHDIGKIPILIKACEYEELRKKPEFLDNLLTKLHPKLGASVLKLWKFDPMVVAVAAEHENLTRNPGDAPVDYVDLIQVANILCYEGSNHPLAGVDRSKIKAFSRIKTSGEQYANSEDINGISEIFF